MAIKNRLKLKKVIDENINQEEQKSSRNKMKSRGSTFSNIDVEAKGNTSNIDHLLRKRLGGNGNHSQLEFEVTLRSYPTNGTFHPPKNWSNIMVTNPRTSPLNKLNDGRKAEYVSSGNLRQSKYLDRYREKNANLLRDICRPGKGVGSLLWEVGLRGKD
jgi:hypothetical protein